MGTVGAVTEVLAITGKIINNYIEDPKRRLRAIQDVIDDLKKMKKETLNETDAEKLDKAINYFIDAVHNL